MLAVILSAMLMGTAEVLASIKDERNSEIYLSTCRGRISDGERRWC
jgi:hypothetical protein